MARVTYKCMTCGAFRVLGDTPGEPGYGYGPDGYLPGDFTSTTCSDCHPELDGLPESEQERLQEEMGLL